MKTFIPAEKPPEFVALNKLTEGDRVSIVASSAQLVTEFPHVYQRGLTRIKNTFKLNPVEYPTTRGSGASHAERARDLMAAFADPDTKAVISLIGGEDQILLLPFLDPQVFRDNPKPFFGYSDNANFSLFLWSLGVPSCYGGCVYTEYGMSGALHPFTEKYLRLALFESKESAIAPAGQFSDQDLSWSEPDNLEREYDYEVNEGWFWDGRERGQGILWGGCLEILALQLQVSKWLPAPQAVEGSVLCLETSELIPDSWHVFAAMAGLGERGYLSGLSGLLVGRPKARAIGKEFPVEARAKYRRQQREVILKEFRRYNQTAPVVFNLDFGHTRPQIPVPLGRMAWIEPAREEIRFSF